MKPRLWASCVIFLSAYAPLALLFAVRDWDDAASHLKHPNFVVGAFIVAAFSVILLKTVCTAFRGTYLVTPKSIEYRSNDLVEYTIPYLISFFGVDFGKIPDVLALALFMSLIFVLSYKTQTIFINPILAIYGFGLYDVELEIDGRSRKVIFLSREGLTPQIPCRVDRISAFLYIVNKPKD